MVYRFYSGVNYAEKLRGSCLWFWQGDNEGKSGNHIAATWKLLALVFRLGYMERLCTLVRSFKNIKYS